MTTASEKTPLMALPSPASTNEPTYTSLPQGTAGPHDDRSTGSLELQSSSDMVTHNSPSLLTQLCGGNKAIMAGIVFVSCLVSAVVFNQPAPSAPVLNTNFHSIAPTSFVAPLANGVPPAPLSILDPVFDMNLFKLVRPAATSPSSIIIRKHAKEAQPTNQWFENLLLSHGDPTPLQRAYTVPYVVDVMGPVPGIQVFPNHIDGSKTVVQLLFVETHGLTLGCSAVSSTSKLTHKYTVTETTSLGITLKWDALPMSSSLVRGMPYATMIYPASSSDDADETTKVIPTIASRVPFRGDPIADGKTSITCDGKHEYTVKSEVQLTADQSDFTWIAFFSRPVKLHCSNTALFFEPVDEDVELVARLALLSNCTANRNPQYCNGGGVVGTDSDYAEMLRAHSDLYPGSNTNIKYDIDDETDSAMLTLDWDVQSMSGKDTGVELVNYALPHQLDHLASHTKDFCTPAMLGRVCIMKGASWAIPEPLPTVGFLAARPPRPSAIPDLAEALQFDMGYKIPDNYMRGAGDTYFSGKMLAKMGRILVVADEVRGLCTGSNVAEAYATACANAEVPSEKDTLALLDLLRAGVEVWINGTAEAPFVYDEGWGGLVSCGCFFNGDTQSCDNIFPDCPVLEDPGLNFGNGFYNDHHFHYGYHVYSAAVVAQYDPAWGRKHFEQVKLLIRDFANPSAADYRFPLFRHKDWYEGHSWASGITLPPYLNGKNQESSSEAIAAYEAVALFGKVMIDAWQECDDCDKHNQLAVARDIKDVGRLLTATEMRVTDRYWHVRLKDESMQIYPKSYSHNVVGILWNTMAQFQTWFGNAPFLPYGIQLLPITAIAEQRDDPTWLREMYKPFADACNADDICEEQGWSVLQLGVMATVGHIDLAMDRAKALPADVFESAGGNGHSRSNTMWFIATRAEAEPIELPKSDIITSEKEHLKPPEKLYELKDCEVPDTCTDEVLDTDAGGHTCRARINYLIHDQAKSQQQACARVAGLEFPDQCGGCNPPWDGADDDYVNGGFTDEEVEHCPPCSEDACNSELNRCPVYDRTFVCSAGPNFGGCQDRPWIIEPWKCNKCCELTHCPKKKKETIKAVIEPSTCPPCGVDICRSRLNLCPEVAAPYLCIEGSATTGCSPRPWDLNEGDCSKCCTVMEGCSAAP